jgi:hypothetical protein
MGGIIVVKGRSGRRISGGRIKRLGIRENIVGIGGVGIMGRGWRTGGRRTRTESIVG